MKAILTTTLCLCIYITSYASEVFYHKNSRMHGHVHHINQQEGWATVSSIEADGKHFRVWIRDLDIATRVRHGLATPAEVLQFNSEQAAAQAAAQLQAEQERADLARQQAAQTALSAQQAAARQHAAQMDLHRQTLELQRRQTEAMERAAFLQFLRFQQR